MAFEATDRVKKKGGAGTFEATSNMRFDESYAARRKNETSRALSEFYKRYDSDMADNAKFFSGEGSRLDRLQASGYKYSSQQYKDEAAKLLSGLERDRGFMSAEEYLAHAQILNGIINQDTAEYDKQINDLWGTKLSMGGNDAYKKALEQYAKEEKLKKKYTIEDGTGAIDILAKAEEARSKAAGSAAGEKPWLREYSDDAERLESIAASRITMDDYKKLSEMYGVKAKESKDGFDNNIKNESKMLQEILEYYKRPHSNGLEADDEEKNMREKLAYFSNKYGTDFADKIRRGETPVIDNIKFFSENDEYNKYKNEAAKYKAAAYFNDITSQIEAELEEKKNAGEDISRLFEIYNPDSVKIPSTTTDLFTRVSNFLLKGNVDEISGTVIPTEDSFSVNYDKATEYMTDDEKAIFNYLINTRGVEAATEYREMLNSEESYFSGIGTRKGYDIYNKYLKDKPVLGELYSVYAGAAGYFNNASNIPAMIKGEEIAPTQNTEQAALGYATSDMGKFGKVAADIGVNFGNMLPSILLSRLGGAASGSAAVASGVNAASVGVTAAAQAYEEAMKEGYDPRSAQGYAMLTGSSEALLEKALGGISGAIGTVTGASVEKLLSKVDNVLARMLIEGGVDMAGEFTEEYLQEVLDPVFRNICFDENNEIKPFSEEALYSGFIGAISAGLMNMGAGAAGIAGAASDVKYGGKINGTKVGDIAVELGQRMSAERAQAGGLYDGEGIRSEFRAVNPNVTATDRQTGNADAVAAGRLAGKILQNTNTSDTSEKKGNMFSRFTQKIKNVQTNYNMARLLNLVGENYSSEIRNAAKKSLIADGMTANNAEGISGIIAESIMSGEPASMALMFARAYNEDADTLTAVSNAYDGIMKDSVLSKVAEMGRGISTGNYNLVEDTKTEQGEAEVGSENNSYAEKPDISDNQTVRVKSIDDITGIDLSAGTVEIHGESVSLDRVDFRDSEVEYLVRTATSDMSSDEAAEMLSAYKKSDIEPGQFGSDWKYYRALGKAANIMPDSEYYKDPGGIFKISAEDKANAYRQGARIRLNAKKQENIEKKNMERAERIGKNYGKVDDKALSSVPRERRKAMRQVADVLSKFGYNIKFFKGSTEIGGMRRSANGIWKADTNTIYLRADAKYNATDIRGILGQTLAHEITHSIQDWSPAKYDELKTYIIEALTRSGDKLSVLVDKKQAAAESRGEKLDVDEAMDEVIADGCEMMLRDSKTLEKMARENRTLFEKVRDKLAEFIEKLRGALKGIYAGTDELHSASAELREVISDFTDMQKLFDEAFEDALGNMKESLTKSDKASENKKSTDGAVLKYSVEYTTDNRPVVIVDDDILKGVPRSQWIKTVKDTISSKFSGGIPIKGRLIKVNNISKNELLRSKYTQYLKSIDENIYADKLRSANSLDEIVLASTNYINEDLNHARKDSIKQFARGNVLLKIGANEYDATVIVGFTSGNEMVLYDIINFNSVKLAIKNRGRTTAMQKNAGSRRKSATSNNSISKNGENVNSEIKKSNGEGLKYSTEESYEEQLDSVLKGTFDRTNAVYMGKTPQILADIGLRGELPMLTTARHLRNANKPKNSKKHFHGLTQDQLAKIPEKISKPVMIMDSLNPESNSIVVVTDMLDTDRAPVVVVVKADGRGMYNNIEIDTNFISSYYGRNEFASFLSRNTAADTLIYINEEKSRKLVDPAQLQSLRKSNNYDFNTIIRKTRAVVNSEIKDSTEDVVSDEDEAHKVRAELSGIKAQIREIAFTKGSDRSLLPELEKKKSILERKILREEREQLAEDMLAVAETETERNFAERYRNTISETSEYEDKLADVKEKIQKAMFGGGDRSKLTALQNQKKQYEARISYRERLLTEYRGYKTFERLSKLREGIAARNAQERIKKRFEKKEARKQRSLMLNDVGKNINRMYAMLKKDTKTKHVASSMKPIVTAFLKSVSTNKVDYDRLIANNRAEIARLEKKRLSLTGEEQQTVTNEIERMKNSIDVYESYIRINKATADALASVLKAYDSAEDTQHLFDKDLYDRVREFAERMDGRTLYELSDSEVAELRDMTRMVSRYITRSNRVFTDERKQTVTQFSKRVIDQTENTQKKYSKLGKKVHDFTEKQRYSIMKPWELFEATGSEEMVRLYRNLQKGEGTWKDLIFKYSDYWKTNAEEKGITRKDLDEKHSILLAGGTEVALRTDDIMAIYAMSKREQARGHLLSETGGYRLPGHVVEVAKKSKGKGTKAKYEYVEGAEPVKLTENDLSNICAKLTDSQREFADLIQKYMSTELAEDGNVVSRALYDVDSFKEKFYFPIYTDKTYGKMCVLRAEGNVRLKSKSFTKETVEKAAGPLILRGFSEVWAEHANEMALYSSFVLPLEDIQKVLDYREPGFSMRQHLGEKLCAEIDDFLNAVNGGIKNTDTGRFAKFFSKYKAARVAGNIRVAIQQPTAIVRAMALIDPKYFFGLNPKAMTPSQIKSRYQEMLTYTATAGVKELGGVDVDTSGSISNYLTDLGKGNSIKRKAGDAADNAFSYLAHKGDQAAWLAIWEACKREVRDIHKNENLSAEEIKKRAAERFDEITNKTQVYDSVFSRSKVMRSGTLYDKMISAFMAEPLTTANMVFEAHRLWKSGNKGTARRYLASVVVCTMITDAAASIADAFRDDDDDETFLEKYAAAFGDNLIHDFNPISYVPFYRDICSLLEGYDVERADMSIFSDVINTGRRAYKAFKNEKEYKGYLVQLGTKILDFTKIPASSLTREIRTISNILTNSSMWGASTKLGFKVAVKEYKDSDKLYYAICDGDDDYFERVSDSIRRELEKKGKDEDEINKFINKTIVTGLKDNDTRIAVAAEAHMNGSTSEYLDLIENIAEDGFDETLVQRATLSAENKLNGDDAGVDNALKGTLYTKSDVIGAVEDGNISIVEDFFNDKVDYYTEQGNKKPEDDAFDSLKNMLSGYYRPLYKAAYDDGDDDRCDEIRDMLTDLRIDGKRVYKSSTVSGWRKSTDD